MSHVWAHPNQGRVDHEEIMKLWSRWYIVAVVADDVVALYEGDGKTRTTWISCAYSAGMDA